MLTVNDLRQGDFIETCEYPGSTFRVVSWDSERSEVLLAWTGLGAYYFRLGWVPICGLTPYVAPSVNVRREYPPVFERKVNEDHWVKWWNGSHQPEDKIAANLAQAPKKVNQIP